MKKLIIILTTTLLLLAMTGCGKEDIHQETGTDPTPTTTQSAATQSPSTQTTTAPSTQAAPVFQEIVLVDNEQITVKITGVTTDPLRGYTLKVFLENKTDKELLFTMDGTSVNGFMCDPFWAEIVAADKKSNSNISWLESDFEENGIEIVEEISFRLRVYDSNDWLAEDILNESFTIKP